VPVPESSQIGVPVEPKVDDNNDKATDNSGKGNNDPAKNNREKDNNDPAKDNRERINDDLGVFYDYRMGHIANMPHYRRW